METTQTIHTTPGDRLEIKQLENKIIIKLIDNLCYSTMIITKEQGFELLEKLRGVYNVQ